MGGQQVVPAPEPGKRVLIVEDSAFIAMDLERILRSAQYDVVGPAQDLATALSLIEAQPIDVALLDVNVNGDPIYPVAQALQVRHIPFAFVTGYDTQSVLPPELRDLPSVTKPFDDGAVTATVAELLAGNAQRL